MSGILSEQFGGNVSSGGFPPYSDTFTFGNGNEIVPFGATRVIIECWGGGSAGTTIGGGGAGYCRITLPINMSDWGSSIPFTVGSGGTSGASGTDSTSGI